METNISSTEIAKAKSRKSSMIAGSILIVIGMFSLLAIIFKAASLFLLPALAVIFLVAGLVTRKTGLIIPGGILAGLGTGTVLVAYNVFSVTEQAVGGIFFAAFAAGFVLISLLSYYTEKGQWITWPLIPAAFMGLFSVALLTGENGLKALEYFGYGWPFILIVIGLYLILRQAGLKK